MSVFILILIPIFALIGFLTRKLKRASAGSQEKIGEMMSTTEETLSGLKIIKGFNGEKLKQLNFLSCLIQIKSKRMDLV